VPVELWDDVRLAAMATVAAPILLKRRAGGLRGQLVLMKGPEVAVRYPEPGSPSSPRSPEAPRHTERPGDVGRPCLSQCPQRRERKQKARQLGSLF